VKGAKEAEEQLLRGWSPGSLLLLGRMLWARRGETVERRRRGGEGHVKCLGRHQSQTETRQGRPLGQWRTDANALAQELTARMRRMAIRADFWLRFRVLSPIPLARLVKSGAKGEG
jgi:hypothetical protein